MSRWPFDDCVVIVNKLPNGEFGAYIEDQVEDGYKGFGDTEMAAIADLNAMTAPTDKDYDARAAKWDHDRDLRKHQS